jgi:sensor domain CHASE-containing protein
VVLSAGVLFAAVSQTDSVVRAQQSALLSTTLAKQLPRIVHDQGGVAIWDDAIENVKVRLDPDWLDANLGVWMHDFFGLDRAFVLTDQNEPAYAMVDGKRATPASFRQVAAAVDPLVAEIRREIPYPVAASDDPPHAAALVQIGGRPAIASVMPILSDTGDVPQESGSEYLHVSIEFLDGTFLSELTKDYSIQSPPFSWTRETDGKEAAVPILQAGGSAFGYAVWMPYQPGWSLLKRTAPTLAASILVLAAIIALLSRRLLRASARARHLAFHDPLSNLANRNLFNETLDRALATRAGDRVGVL